MPSGCLQGFAGFGGAGSPGEVWVGQAPHPTSARVPALAELASAPREEPLGLLTHTGFTQV